MNEKDLRGLIEDVRRGKLSRRAFTRAMIAVGLTAPMAVQMLASSGAAMAAEQPVYRPTRRGGGGALKVLWWQGPTLLNPHIAVGLKDLDGSRIFYEPLAAYASDGSLVPVLAAEIPSLENGGLGEDGMSVTWKLKQGVRWHDGMPFTADDCVFTWQYAADPATAAMSVGSYQDIDVVKLDDYTIRIEFPKPRPFWADAFVGLRGIIPRHVFAPFKGANAHEAPANLAPVGTGPYVFVDFKPGDLIKGRLNPDYHMPNRPHFDAIELKGGGDAVSAARAVLQTGEYDFAWTLQVEDEILKRLEAGGKGRLSINAGGFTEAILLNNTDPWKEVDGERSSIKTSHPCLTDPAVRNALNLLVDRAAVHRHIYGRTGIDTANIINGPAQFVSPNTHYEFSIDKAIRLLEEAGWKPGADGVREKNGVRLKLVYQTTTNAPRQKIQAIVKQACQKAGIDVEIKVGRGLGVLFFRRREPGYIYAFLLRPGDVQRVLGAGGSAHLHAAVPVERGGEQGEQVPGTQRDPLAERGVRQALRSERHRTRSGQAGGAVHRHERSGGEERRGHPGGRTSRRERAGEQSPRAAERMGHELLRAARLVSRLVMVAACITRPSDRSNTAYHTFASDTRHQPNG